MNVNTDIASQIVDGSLSDAFAWLGPHERDGHATLTVFVPGADRVTCLQKGAGKTEMTAQAGYPGLFVCDLPKREPYSLRAENQTDSWDFEDPYRFPPVISDDDLYFVGEGTHRRIWHVLGAHVMKHKGVQGVHFAVWAPNASRVSVIGDFNIWDSRRHGLRPRGQSGIWEIFIPGVAASARYKYEIRASDGTVLPLKADPVGFGAEPLPGQASVVHDLARPNWRDGKWRKSMGEKQSINAPLSIYEVHIGSWKRADGHMLSYDDLASDLVDYAAGMGFTHIELMPVSEHPFDGSWGYQPVGLFAPTARHGTPDQFRSFIKAAHKKGLGVILDWVPGHFPADAHGLAEFDGTALFEHADPREGYHQDWNTLIYNYGRREVANFLTANALYWLEEFHVDGLRVDAVASMLYRDYSRQPDEWVPNKDGGNENYEAIGFLQNTNTICYGEVPGIVTIAEESTAFPAVSAPVDAGGLGFGFKWNMGWMNDTLSYIQTDPLFRRYHHGQITFGLDYAFSENFVLPISHDEVVHGKGSMLQKMPGSDWEKFANLRAYYGFMWTHPGKKLLFMGQEFAQVDEWHHDRSLDWHLLDDPAHAGIHRLIGDLNRTYRENAALHVNDCRAEGFGWIEAGDADNSIFAYQRRGGAGDPPVVVVANFTPVEHHAHRIGFPEAGKWAEILNTDAHIYGGGGMGNFGSIETSPQAWMGQDQSATVTLPPLSVVVFRHEK